MNTVAFDLDGTLADTSGDLIFAANSVLSEKGYGTPLDFESDKLTAFLGGRALLRAGITAVTGEPPEAVLDDGWYAEFLDRYEQDIDRLTQPYPGVDSVIPQMRKSGWKLAICTNKPERLARILMNNLGMLTWFDSLVGADTLPVRKPHPDPLLFSITSAGGRADRSVFVGDTETDLLTARAAGTPVILVSFGPEQGGVERYRPDALLDSFDELPTVAERLVRTSGQISEARANV